MPNNVNANVKLIVEQLKKMAKDSTDGEQIVGVYTDLINSCEDLDSTLDKYSKPYPDGKLPLIKRDDRETILEKYQSVANTLEAVMDLPTAGEMAQFKYLASFLEKLIGKDMKGFIAMDKPYTVTEIIENSRRSLIENNQPTEKIGANLSSRMVLSYGEGEIKTKGVFTQSTNYADNENKWKELTEKYTSAYPKYANLFERVANNPNYRSIEKAYVTVQNSKYDFNEYADELRERASSNNLDIHLSDDLQEALANDNQFATSYYGFLEDCFKLANSIEINEGIIGLKKGESIDERNCAMSMVSELLNNKDILVHSETCSVNKDGVITDGSIMNFASGVDVNNLAPDDPFRDITHDSINTPSLKEQLANLQVIDYICGNVDRHGANMLYQVKDGKVVGIVGIDNDASFPTDNDLLTGVMRNPGLIGLGVIDETMAKRISTLTPAMLKLGLRGYNLSESAIEKSAERLQDLQKVISNSPIYDGSPLEYSQIEANQLGEVKLTIIPTEKWNDIDVNELANNTQSYFCAVNDFVGTQKNLSPEIKQMKLDRSLIKTNVVTTSARNANALEKITKELADATGFLRGSSKLYKDIQKSAKELSVALKNINIDYNKQNINDCLKALDSLKGLTEQYIQSKQGLRNNDYTKKRLGIVTELNGILNSGKQEFESELKSVDKLDKKIDAFEQYAENSLSQSEDKELQERLKNDGNLQPDSLENDSPDVALTHTLEHQNVIQEK